MPTDHTSEVFHLKAKMHALENELIKRGEEISSMKKVNWIYSLKDRNIIITVILTTWLLVATVSGTWLINRWLDILGSKMQNDDNKNNTAHQASQGGFGSSEFGSDGAIDAPLEPPEPNSSASLSYLREAVDKLPGILEEKSQALSRDIDGLKSLIDSNSNESNSKIDDIKNAIDSETKFVEEEIKKLPDNVHGFGETNNSQAAETSGSIGYKLALGFQIKDFSVFSKNPGATLDDLFKAIKDGAESGKEVVSLADKVLIFYQSLRSSLPKEEGSAGQIVLLDQNIPFDLDKIILNQEATKPLSRVISYLNSEAGRSEKILVEGHTDATGSSEYNKKLSQRRAEAVRDYLVNGGVESNRIEVFGYGEGYLWMPFLPSHADNRRVRIVSCTPQGAGPSRCQTDK